MEKSLQELNRLFFEDTRGDFAGMIQGRLLQEIKKSPRCAAFRVTTAEDNPPDAAMYDRSGAHRAGLLGDVEITIGEAPVPLGFLRLSEGEHLGMGRRVPQRFDLVGGPCNDRPLREDDGSDGHFLCEIGLLRLTQCLAHHERIA